MIKKILQGLFLSLCLFGTVGIECKQIAGTIAAQNSGSFQPIAGNKYSVGTPTLIQPLVFGRLGMGFTIPVTFDKPFKENVAIVVTYGSDTTSLIGVTSPFFGPAIDYPGPALNQITGVSVVKTRDAEGNITGFLTILGFFIDGITLFPDVETAVTTFSDWGLTVNFIAREI